MKNLFLPIQSSQCGRGTLGCFLGLVLVAVLVFAAYKLVPPFVGQYRLKDATNEIAVLGAAGLLPSPDGSSRKPGSSVSEIQDAVMRKAKELDIPLRKQDINVRRDETTVFITVKYTVPIGLPGSVYDFHFEFTSHN